MTQQTLNNFEPVGAEKHDGEIAGDTVETRHHPIRDRFTDPNAADLPDLVIQTFQMLDVHRG